MDNIKAFALGIAEFRSDLTRAYDDARENWYDAGREFAHRITFRKFDQAF